MIARRVELLAIGSELLGPLHLDTNGSFLSRRLGERGMAVRFRTTVGDSDGDLRAAFRVALDRSDLILATGGLGPTVDDRTREAIAAVLDLPLIEDAAIAAEIEARFRRHGLTMPPQNRRQAQVPRGAEVLPNRLGTAPGLLIRSAGALIALLPGVPSEMRAMTDEELLPRLGAQAERHVYRVLKITGLTESEVDRRLSGIEQRAPNLGWTILAGAAQIEIHLRELVPGGAEPVVIPKVEEEIRQVLGIDLFGCDDDTLEGTVGRLLLERRESLAVAESLTGGLIAQRLTDIAGASRYFLGGVVGYADRVKIACLGVGQETLDRHAAVSEEVVAEMAAGVRERLKADWGLAASGYAGPAGGGAERPAGTVMLGVA
ncbi:MAG TPA: CinA family nicotinamide mononucleotide deamidase-related protein, partial [Candidatus Polarisedimenticolia bacterium]|nr:CinA family nicotinamide mononucleotide deamidase-related protein [Candidatus Polarisedimenticolia bacterium]